MSSLPALSSLELIPYLDETGGISDRFDGKVGVYAIFDREQELQYIGYSRDVSLSLRQHLVRKPQSCYWVKVETIDRPSRTVLEDIKAAWIADNGEVPSGNSREEGLWNQPIDAKTEMTEDERSHFAASDEVGQMKLLKQVARRKEEAVLAELQARGVQMQIRFNPKLKESGLLDLKS